ncbi:MAG TPA: hypothetical protein VGD78_18145 [Chthoniobacterales bacterium]
MARSFFIPYLALSLLGGCASSPPPPLGVDNPASPLAPAARTQPLPHTLGRDALTKQARQAFVQAGKMQPPANGNAPAAGESSSHPMEDIPSMQAPSNHDPSAPQDSMGGMPGMEMPPAHPSPTPASP